MILYLLTLHNTSRVGLIARIKMADSARQQIDGPEQCEAQAQRSVLRSGLARVRDSNPVSCKSNLMHNNINNIIFLFAYGQIIYIFGISQ